MNTGGGIMKKTTNVLLLFVLTLLILFSCESKNPLGVLENGAPRLGFSEEKINLDGGEFSYLQEIRVDAAQSASLQYAYRPQCLPGKILPGYQTDDQGWILFGDDIWTSQSKLNFTFNSDAGTITNLITEVAVKVKHLDGHIEDLFSAFKSNRILGSYLENQINPGDQLSAGIEFRLREAIGDVFVDGMYAGHFMYRINILNSDLVPITTGQWFSSIDSPDIRKVHLSGSTTPALAFNAPNTYTQFEYYVVSRLGVEQAEPGNIYFQVVDGFQPVAVIYPQTLAGFGSYHYSLSPDLMMNYQALIPGDGQRYNRRLWEVDGVLSAINSDDFKLHLHWGYHGLYYNKYPVMPLDDPLEGEETGIVLNSNGVNYGSSIQAFWLQLDGGAFPIADHQQMGNQIITDEQGTWTRILNLNHGFRHAILEDLANGNHTFRVMAEDLQGVRSEPAQLVFNLVPYKAPEARSGVLVVDNDPHNSTLSPETTIDDFYQSVIPGFMGPVHEIDFGLTDVLPAPVLNNYRAVLIHADSPASNPLFYKMYEGMDFYLKNQGNLVISSTNRMKEALQSVASNAGGAEFLEERLGIDNIQYLSTFSNSLAINPYLVSAEGLDSYPDIALNTATPFSAVIGSVQGLSCVTLFDPLLSGELIYGFGCKAVGEGEYSPSQDEFDLYSSKYVAYRYQNQESKVFLLGFPLSFMEQSDATLAFQHIFSDISGTSYAKGRNK